MLSKLRQEQSIGNSSDSAASNSSVESVRLPDARGIKNSPTPPTITNLPLNGLQDDSGKVGRHVHWKSNSKADRKQNPSASEPKQHSIGGVGGVGGGSVGGIGRVSGGELGAEGAGSGGGGGVGPLSVNRRLIAVKPFAATSDDEERRNDDDVESVDAAADADGDGDATDPGHGLAFTPSVRVMFEVTPKNAVTLSQLGEGTSPLESHSDLPVIDLELDVWTGSGAEGGCCVNELPIGDVRASGLRLDAVKPKSFLADFNGKADVTKPVTAFDDSINSTEAEPSSIPLVTVTYLRHDSLAATGDAARGSTISEIPNAQGHSNDKEVVVVETFDAGPKKTDETAPTDAPPQTDSAASAPPAPPAPAAAAAPAPAASDPSASAPPAAADVVPDEPLPSASSSSSQSLDRSSDVSVQPNAADPEDRSHFARVQPDEAFLEKRGECDGEEAPPPVYILPGSNLRYTDDMILTTRPSKVNLLYRPAPPRTRILFQVIRDKVGFYRKYYAHLELNGEKIFYLAGRKRVKSRSSSYVISIDRERLLRDCDAYVGKLRSNYVGTKFTLYYTARANSTPNSEETRTGARSKNTRKEELASIIYAPNPLGFYGPRRMTVLLPAITDSGDLIQVTPPNAVATKEETLLGRYKARQHKDLIILHNKPPVWERAKNSYVLNFHGRVTQPSVKNFQLVPPDDHNDIVMQFGRTGANTFTMDYRRPFSAVQAFGVVLSCFDCKLACE